MTLDSGGGEGDVDSWHTPQEARQLPAASIQGWPHCKRVGEARLLAGSDESAAAAPFGQPQQGCASSSTSTAQRCRCPALALP